MTGSRSFRLVKPFIMLLIFLIKPLPLALKMLMFDFFSIIPSKVGVLLRYVFAKSMFKKMGNNVYIGRFITLKNPQHIEVGDNVSFHEYVYLDGLGGLSIGDDVSIAHSTSLITFEHQFNDPLISIKYNLLKKEKITILSDVWIGCGVRVLAGTHISSRTIIAAGSVVKGKLLSHQIYAGVPAKPKKSI